MFMGQAIYRVVLREDKWFVLHDGDEAGPYITSETAFEAAVAPASMALQDGHEVQIHVQAGIQDAMGAKGGL
jgi:hypothetical protein